jgi:hypothetical protein
MKPIIALGLLFAGVFAGPQLERRACNHDNCLVRDFSYNRDIRLQPVESIHCIIRNCGSVLFYLYNRSSFSNTPCLGISLFESAVEGF